MGCGGRHGAMELPPMASFPHGGQLRNTPDAGVARLSELSRNNGLPELSRNNGLPEGFASRPVS